MVYNAHCFVVYSDNPRPRLTTCSPGVECEKCPHCCCGYRRKIKPVTTEIVATLPQDIILSIGDHCNLCNLVSLSAVDNRFNEVLKPQLKQRKRDMMSGIGLINVAAVYFCYEMQKRHAQRKRAWGRVIIERELRLKRG